MNFRRFLRPESVRLEMRTRLEPEGELPPDFAPGDRRNLARIQESVIEELAELLSKSGEVSNPSRLFRDLFNREKKAATSVGQGIAIPHVRTLQAKSFIMAFGRSAEGLPFETPDGEPVRLFFRREAKGWTLVGLERLPEIWPATSDAAEQASVRGTTAPASTGR